jgi:signal transduction histidine kinase
VLGTLTSEMKRLTKLVNMILEYQKFESRDTLEQKENFQPYQVIQELIHYSETKAKKTKQLFQLSGSEHIEIYAEHDLFKQLVHNII